MIGCILGEKYVLQVTGDAITAQVETILTALDDKTEMKITWSGRGKIFLLKLLLPLLRRKMIRQSRAELALLRELVETKGFKFNEG